MSAPLAFLTPAGGPLPGGPPARSPLADAVAAAGALLAVRDGWEVAESFGDPELERRACREAVGFADRSALGKLELRGSAAALAELLGATSLGVAEHREHAWWCPVAPDHALVLCEPAATAGLRSRLRETWDGHYLDVTAALGALTLAGPAARETLARFCALDLRDRVTPVGAFRPGSVARTPGFVLREAGERFLMLFGAAHASYVWQTVSDAAERLGGRPVGQWVLDA